MELPSTKPYLLRAIWEWCCDNGFTPHIAVDVDERTRVPREFVRDGQIVLNLGPDATKSLLIGNDFIDFQARFGGVARDLSVPIARVSAIYARENGAGMAFEVDGAEDQADAEFIDAGEAAVEPEEPPPEPPRPEAGRPWLQRIK
ncbi:ClpXP protease specificity-enhancing factor [Ferribacterium limneticum]|uniref:ClpXP protease specificity-enhancing factor n=1 Tax=Ferribacterium limneticum TaxID=76259 RepID=UPI001CFA73AE|nr:ClpXP protease specificity-enhancing factor [Ferribacterium limneticum]UCV19793.1 ClpXP protease specificity-enhancing factor [Ferribacterium limneticum]